VLQVNVNFAQFIVFKNKKALPESDWITRVVITKVNHSHRKTADQINAPGGLKHQYGSAFKCCEGHHALLHLHGYDQFNDEDIAHAARKKGWITMTLVL
jgi:hypothetical protein